MTIGKYSDHPLAEVSADESLHATQGEGAIGLLPDRDVVDTESSPGSR
jgi:hypothetical protein